MTHFLHGRHHGRFGRRIFAFLLIGLGIVAIGLLIRRSNLRRAGVVPRPLFDDLRDMYASMLDRFDQRDFNGVFGEIFGKSPMKG